MVDGDGAGIKSPDGHRRCGEPFARK